MPSMRRCSICLKIGEKKLDEAGIDYDWGPLDRLIVENDEDCDEVEDILDECDIAYFAV